MLIYESLEFLQQLVMCVCVCVCACVRVRVCVCVMILHCTPEYYSLSPTGNSSKVKLTCQTDLEHTL